MDAQLDDKALENTLAESLADLVPDTKTVSEDEFVEVVGGALEAVGGTLLFKMCVQNEGEGQHVAAASDRRWRQSPVPAAHLADRRWLLEGRDHVEKQQPGGRYRSRLCRAHGCVQGRRLTVSGQGSFKAAIGQRHARAMAFRVASDSGPCAMRLRNTP